MMQFTTAITIVTFFQLMTYSNASQKYSYDFKKPYGQTKVSHLRDAVSVSNFGTHFGRRGSALISKRIVTPEKIWQAVDDTTREFLSTPDNLDWLVVDVAADNQDSVTINFGFSCLDKGKSESLRLVWWVDEDLRPLETTKNTTGGAQEGTRSHKNGETKTDLVLQCWYSQKPDIDLRVFEHTGIHKGEKDILLRDVKPQQFFGDKDFFRRIKKLRQSVDRADEVVRDNQTSIPVVIGLPFSTGFRLIAPSDVETGSATQFRIPGTPHFAIRSHMEGRLSDVVFYPVESTTSNVQVVLSVLSTGLAVILAVWIVMKLAADSAKQKFCILKKLGPRAVVQGRHADFNEHQMQLVHQIIGVTILSAPFAFAIVNGEADPSKSVIVTTGSTVFYGAAKESMSSDTNNSHAGAPFVVTGWLSVINLDDGHYVAFSMSVAFVLLASFYVAVREGKRWSETMPHTPCLWPGFSLWKSHGVFKMWMNSFQREDDRDIYFQVLVELADCSNFDSSETEPLLVASSEFRRLIRDFRCCKLRRKGQKAKKNSGACELRNLLEEESDSELLLYANVVMNNRYRFEAMMAGTSWWYNRLPREFYYLTNRMGPSAKSVEWYRTNGQYLPDELLIPVRLGLLPYIDQVKRISIAVLDTSDVKLDGDGVNACIVSRDTLESSDDSFSDSEQWPVVRMLHDGYDHSRMLDPAIFRFRSSRNPQWNSSTIRISSPRSSDMMGKVQLQLVSIQNPV